MNLRILLTFTFVFVQLLFYGAICTDNHADFQKKPVLVRNFVINSAKDGMLNKTSNDGHFICQNNSSKSITSHKEANGGFLSSIAPTFKFSNLYRAKYLYKNNFLTINCTKLAYSTEINIRAP